MYQCFHTTRLTENVADLLLRLIANEHQTLRTIIADRLEKFLPQLSKHDFLYQYDVNSDAHPIEHSLNVFYGFWAVLSNLEVGRNYLKEENKSDFFDLLIYLSRYNKIIDVSEEIVRWVQLTNINLIGSDLSKTTLKYANLEAYNLNKTNLYGASLINVDLSCTNLSAANLGQAYLFQVDLSHANLSETNLSEANLFSVNLSEAENITFEQLASTKSLRGTIGIPKDIEKRLRKEYPRRFK